MAWRAAALLSSVEALRLGIMVTSRWSAFERRQLLRHAVAKCKEGLQGEIELLFFMANPSEEHEAAAWQEESQYGDLVEVGGPDSDPPVMRDVTYVLDRPCARTYRLLHGSKWLAEHRPNHDYVMYLDDDSFLNLPRLMAHLERQNSDSLAMGFVMETELDWSQTHVCELCNPCEMCRKEECLKAFCAQFQNVSMGGCMMAIENCEIFDGADTWIGVWVSELQLRIVRFLGRNAHRLKSKGAADVSLGFWLAPLEGVRFVSMNEGFFHDHPDARTLVAGQCLACRPHVHKHRNQLGPFDSFQ
eukprot:g12861.t1